MRQVERQRIQVAVIAIAVLVSLLGLRHARADGGALRWQDRVEGPGGSASAASLAVHGGRAFASGLIVNATGNADSLLRAYDLRTGEVLWWDQFDGAGGSDAGWAVAATDDAVFTAIQSAVGPGNSDWVVRAHDAANGALLWQNRYDRAGRTDRPVLMVAHDGEVFVAGRAMNGAGNFDSVVRAYDARAGALLWADVVDTGGTDQAATIVAAGDRLFAAGQIGSAAGARDFMVRALDAHTGALLWQDRFDPAGRPDIATSLAVQGGRLFAAGAASYSAGNSDFLVRAYDAQDGRVLWQDRLDVGGRLDEAFDIDVVGGRVVAVGQLSDAAGNADWIVRCYDAATGTLLWQDRRDVAGRSDVAVDVAIRGDQVVVSGFGGSATTGSDFLVRAYDAHSGSLLWQDQFDLAGRTDEALSNVLVKGNLVLAAGDAVNGSGRLDFLVRAYEIR